MRMHCLHRLLDDPRSCAVPQAISNCHAELAELSVLRGERDKLAVELIDARAQLARCDTTWDLPNHQTSQKASQEKTWEFEISWRRGLGAGRPGGVWSLFRLHSAILGRLVPQ